MLLEARQSGRGQVVDAAMADGAASLMTYMFASHAAGAWSDRRGENVLDGNTAPWYGVYETADGRYVSIASAEPQFYAELLRLTGLAGQALPDQLDRGSWPAFRAHLVDLFRTKTRDEWCALMEGSDVCFAPVLTLGEAMAHPHNRARGTFVEVDGVTQPAPAPRFKPHGAEHAAASDAARGERHRHRAGALGLHGGRGGGRCAPRARSAPA